MLNNIRKVVVFSSFLIKNRKMEEKATVIGHSKVICK